MTLAQRIGKIIGALLTVLCAWVVYRMGEDGFLLVSLLLSISLIIYGARNIIFYFTMARHMVDGRNTLYIGVIAMDFGIFTMSASENKGLFIVVYLLAAHAVSGVVSILRAMEARRLDAPLWRLNLAEGIANLGIAGAAVLFGVILGNMRNLTLIYVAGLLYSALLRLISVFRKTAIVYIP